MRCKRLHLGGVSGVPERRSGGRTNDRSKQASNASNKRTKLICPAPRAAPSGERTPRLASESAWILLRTGRPCAPTGNPSPKKQNKTGRHAAVGSRPARVWALARWPACRRWRGSELATSALLHRPAAMFHVYSTTEESSWTPAI